MDIKQYIFPIYSGGTIIGQCFIADGYLITAAHVIKDFSLCFTRINGKRFEFPKVYSVTEEPIFVGEEPFFMGRGDYNHDSTSLDIVMFRCDDVHSPLHLSTGVLQKGEKLDNYCLHEVMDFSLLNPPCELRMVQAIVRGEEEGNYFYCNCKQFGGSSGSPLLKGNEVVGIMHGGNENGLCAFLRTDVVSKIISRKELSVEYDEWDFEHAWEYEGCTYSKDKKRLLQGTDNTIHQSTIVICNEAFCRYDYKGKIYGLASSDLIIPSSVKIIGKRAFAWSRDLETVVIPDSVIEIGEKAFFCCSKLKQIKLPNSISRIGNDTFGGCQWLENIEIPNSVTSIGESAFSGCENLFEIVIPNSVESIGEFAFEECSSLFSVYLPDSICEIGHGVFDQCKSLERIIIPSGAMKKFKELLPDYIDLLAEEVSESNGQWEPYGEAYSLKDIWDVLTYPDEDKYEQIDGDVAEVIAIESEEGKYFLRIEIPFKDSSSVELKLSPLSKLEEGDKVVISTIVGQEFHRKGYASIVRYDGELYLSTEVTKEDLANAWTDEYEVKYSLDKKRLLKAPNNLNKYLVKSGTIVICNKAFCQCKELQSVQLPNSVTTIGDFAFYNCEKLTSAIIPKSATNMGMCVFEGCERLSSYHPFE